MKIENNPLNISMPQSDRVQEQSRPDSRLSSRTSSLSGGSDAVDLGSQAGLVATAQNAGSADRTSVVQRLRALVQSGQYQVDSAALSESIVAAGLSGC